jgi:hypothetical protein
VSYVRVSILGSISGEEVWSVNPVFDPTGEFPGGVSQAALDAAALAIASRSVPADLLVLLSGSCTRTGARVEVRDDASDDLIGLSQQSSPVVVAGTGALRMSSTSALVCSIRTNTPGPSGRGRLYWPAMGANLTGVGRLLTPSTAVAATAFKSYLLGMRTDLATAFPTIGFDLAVRSRTTKTTPHAVRIQVGNVIDNQRRRKDALAEQYSALAFP